MAIKGEYEYLEIRDRCKFQLVKYLENVLNNLPEFNNSIILDIGCGSGMPVISKKGHPTQRRLSVNYSTSNFKGSERQSKNCSNSSIAVTISSKSF